MLSTIHTEFKQHYAAMVQAQKCNTAVQAMMLDPDNKPFVTMLCQKLPASQLEKMQYNNFADHLPYETLGDYYNACFTKSVANAVHLIRENGGASRFSQCDNRMMQYTESMVDMMNAGMLHRNELGVYYALESMLPDTHHWGFKNIKELIEPQMSAVSWVINAKDRLLQKALPHYYKDNQKLYLCHENLWNQSEFNPRNVLWG